MEGVAQVAFAATPFSQLLHLIIEFPSSSHCSLGRSFLTLSVSVQKPIFSPLWRINVRKNKSGKKEVEGRKDNFCPTLVRAENSWNACASAVKPRRPSRLWTFLGVTRRPGSYLGFDVECAWLFARACTSWSGDFFFLLLYRSKALTGVFVKCVTVQIKWNSLVVERWFFD